MDYGKSASAADGARHREYDCGRSMGLGETESDRLELEGDILDMLRAIYARAHLSLILHWSRPRRTSGGVLGATGPSVAWQATASTRTRLPASCVFNALAFLPLAGHGVRSHISTIDVYLQFDIPRRPRTEEPSWRRSALMTISSFFWPDRRCSARFRNEDQGFVVTVLPSVNMIGQEHCCTVNRLCGAAALKAGAAQCPERG
ncbi:hypothetical protein CVT26_012412 [Gymnopilus dilepis]|uniref:Uncharacterized protein n=1 Tax=Gymnopilus dilepis TaxID=231916 RepID=A0A409YQI4_9AGAR|nr:hypothetical protein CVT26_012412 [Gymnopilus dilepis]